MMRFLLLMLVFHSTFLFAQENEIDIYQPDLHVFYSGFGSVISLKSNGKINRNAQVICRECDTIYRVKEHTYLVKPGKTDSIQLQVVSRKGNVLHALKYKVRALPIPEVKIDGFATLDTLTISPRKISLHTSLDEFVYVGFAVRSWKVTINQTVFEGFGHTLSEKFIQYLETQRQGMFLIEIQYIGPNQAVKLIKGAYFFTL